MVNVFPDPVTPMSVWYFSPLSIERTIFFNRRRLIAGRLEWSLKGKHEGVFYHKAGWQQGVNLYKEE